MYACESWTIKKAECWRIDAFELWYWRRLLRLLDYKEIKPVHSKGNQSWIFIGRTDAEAEAPILWLPDAKNWLTGRLWCWEGLKAEEGDDRGWYGWMASMTRWTWVWASSGSWWWEGKPGVWQSMVLQSRTRLSDWTEVNVGFIKLIPKMKEFWVAQDWTPGVGDGQGGLACCDSWGHKESDMTERLKWTELNFYIYIYIYIYI